MRYVSTRGSAPAVGFSEALARGLAPDGGLYVPETFPRFAADALAGVDALPQAMGRFLEPFVGDDPLAGELEAICRGAFDFPLELTDLDPGTRVLELFHGPTAAFKDFGARFLAECFQRRDDVSESRPLTVLVATSGDTGGAVASAFHGKPGIRVGILFPAGGVSPRQEGQLTCWGDNVQSFAVRGSFDDCQRVVKRAFGDPDWSAAANLTSANSINVGRLLPQAAYYAVSSTRHLAAAGRPASFVIPSGNMGNAVGAFWARHVGFPIDRIALATNANRTVPDWFAGGDWRPRPSLQTLANAMDVGDPSNMERLFRLYPDRESLLAAACSLSVDDATIREVIAEGPGRYGRVWCPHTATAVRFREQLPATPHVVVATAHPAKFDEIVEPLIGREVELPPALAELLERPRSVTEIDADLGELRAGMG